MKALLGKLKERAVFRPSRLLDLPIKKKLYLIIGLLIGNVVLLISFATFAFNTLSSIRAAVAAEDIWAKSQKTAVYGLGKYALSQDEGAYQDYLEALKIPVAYARANQELRKPHPDLAVLTQAFLEGGIHVRDIPGVARLFIHLQKAPHVAQAFAAWAQAQDLVKELQSLAHQLRISVLSGKASKKELGRYVDQIDDMNHKLTKLEIEFSTELGEASRLATSLFLWLMIGGSVFVGLLSAAIALYISGAIVAGIDKISNAAAQAAGGDLKVRVGITTQDELGELARAFNHMVHGLGELDRLKTEFFANVSHEFRTPLTLMLGPLETCLAHDKNLMSVGDRENIVVAHRNALRLLKLVNTLLDFSRVQADRAQATFRPTDLATLTGHLASSFDSAVANAGLEFTIDCPPLPEPVYVDSVMWEKIVLNLISNAFKFTAQGRITVSQRVYGDRLELVVKDTGCGIPEPELGNVFKRFYRVDGTVGRSHEGTGIGLALVEELVKIHGGTVSVASTLGRGSTFTVSIPLGKNHLPPERVVLDQAAASPTAKTTAYVAEAIGWLPAAKNTSAAPLQLGASNPNDRNKPRVLLAEDNADMRVYIAGLLARDYEVTAVADGEAAWTKILEKPPDLILSDVMMPKLDGFGLLMRLRQDDRCRSVPYILVSARAGEESKVEGLSGGADDYLIKPFSALELLARIRTNLEKSSLRLESARREEQLHAKEKINGMLAEELHRKDEFLAMLAHELRNPLAVISGAVQVVSRDGLLPETLDILKDQVERLFRLIDSLLDVSRANQSANDVSKEAAI